MVAGVYECEKLGGARSGDVDPEKDRFHRAIDVPNEVRSTPRGHVFSG